MIECPVCRDPVFNTLLREEYPKCPNGHDIGRWATCLNASAEKHVYLDYKKSFCPYCGSAAGENVRENTTVKCLHVNAEGLVCVTRPFRWITEGPPCFMNHVSKMKVLPS